MRSDLTIAGRNSFDVWIGEQHALGNHFTRREAVVCLTEDNLKHCGLLPLEKAGRKFRERRESHQCP
jgi:hypothetical protein